MTDITRRTALLGATALAIPALPSPAATAGLAGGKQRFREEGRGRVYLAWLDKERRDVARALGHLLPDGRVLVDEVRGLTRKMEATIYDPDTRAKINMILIHGEELKPLAWELGL